MSLKNLKNVENRKTNKSKSENSTINENFSSPQLTNKFKTEEDISDLEKIKNNLKYEGGYMQKLNSVLKALEEEENNEINLYTNENELKREIEKNNKPLNLLDDNEFKYKLKKIFLDVYGLKEKILSPYFCEELSWNKKLNTIKLYYYKVEIQINGKNSTSFAFLDDKNTYLAYFEGIPMIFQKYKGIFNNVTIITKEFNNWVNFQIKNENNAFQASFLYAEICNELLAIKGKINEIKNKIYSLDDLDTNKNKNEKKDLTNLLELYQKKFYLIEKKYSKERLNDELTIKTEELQLLDLNIELGEVHDVNDEQRNSIKKEIEKYNNLLRLITIKIQKKYKAFDGFFISNKTINLENTIGDKLEIPPKSPITIEIKNHCKYSDVISNLIKKKKIFESIGFQKGSFYFAGILKGLDLDDKTREEINIIKQNYELTNMIVIYPDNAKFLNVPLYDIEDIKESSKKIKPEYIEAIKELKESLFKEMDKKFDEWVNNYINK